MDEDGLPLVGAGIDYTKVGAIHQKRTLAFLNHFITHTARFLNRFSCVCEEKLADLSVRLQRLETTLSLLETKLASVPGLENITAPSTQQQQPQQTAQPDGSEGQPAAPPPPGGTPAEQPQEEDPQPEPESTQPKVKDDPRYIPYFKMLNFGVPPPAIKGKMKAEGRNPDLLDTPDAPAPPGDGNGNQSSEDDDSDNGGDSDDSSGFSD